VIGGKCTKMVNLQTTTCLKIIYPSLRKWTSVMNKCLKFSIIIICQLFIFSSCGPSEIYFKNMANNAIKKLEGKQAKVRFSKYDGHFVCGEFVSGSGKVSKFLWSRNRGLRVYGKYRLIYNLKAEKEVFEEIWIEDYKKCMN